jgi:iron complex outermembrane receptor protein
VPKVGLRWQPVDDQFTVRYTYSKAFTAPDLWHEYGPPSVTAASGTAVFAPSNLGVTDPNLLKPLSYFSGNGNNPELQPSHAWSRSMGFVLSPKVLKGFTISVDYVDVFQKGLPAGIGATNIVNSVNALGSSSPYFSGIAVGAIPGTPGASQTAFASPNGIYNYLVANNYNASNIYIADHFVNSGGVHVEAYDITPEYSLPTRSMGTFTIGTTGTYLQHFLFSALPGQPFYEFAGYSTNTQTEAGSFPHYSFYTTFDWKYRNWETTIGNNYMSSMIDVGPAPAGKTYAPANYLAVNPAIPVAYYTSWDAQLAYTVDKEMTKRLLGWINGIRVSVGVNDLFNRMPPYAGLSQSAKNNYNNVDTTEYSPIGRLFYVTASLKY